MRGKAAILGVFLAIGATRAQAAQTPPDLAQCPAPESPDGGERQRTRALPVPAPLRSIMKSELLHYTVATLGGGTLCIDTSWKDTAEDISLSPDGRFLSFGWMGYETYGHIVVDRTGKGEEIDTGVAPVFSPSRRYFAAADQTESEYGSLSGLAVWEVGPAGTKEIGRVDGLPRMNGWRIDSWGSESCIEMSAIPQDQSPETGQRIRFRAGPGKDGWHVAREPKGCAGR